MARPLPTAARLREILRYYQAGILNTAFGYGAYAALVAAGLGMFAAQLVAHLAGIAFNYLTYSRWVFRGSERARLRFVASYGVNYLLSLAALAAAARVIASPYLAGLAAIVVVSIINYVLLSRYVFVSPPEPR